MRIITPFGEQRETNRFVEANPGNEEIEKRCIIFQREYMAQYGLLNLALTLGSRGFVRGLGGGIGISMYHLGLVDRVNLLLRAYDLLVNLIECH